MPSPTKTREPSSETFHGSSRSEQRFPSESGLRESCKAQGGMETLINSDQLSPQNRPKLTPTRTKQKSRKPFSHKHLHDMYPPLPNTDLAPGGLGAHGSNPCTPTTKKACENRLFSLVGLVARDRQNRPWSPGGLQPCQHSAELNPPSQGAPSPSLERLGRPITENWTR